ncbi:MAG: VOC family protein [Rhodospirillum sp.]|nr:VOC family protein [Rhodospirillum sp.]MCF8491536.1 VOC family protein [Rhodospirillum sp.]MCF8501416.1 VOC family protein [Rhodospirillum sp.]
MPFPNYTILYVADPRVSARFYADILDLEPVESSDTFALFNLPNGHKLGLWSRHTVAPGTDVTGGGCELAFSLDGADTLDALHATWAKKGIPLPMAPTDMDFGRSFLALDPDGHRLRPMAPRIE